MVKRHMKRNRSLIKENKSKATMRYYENSYTEKVKKKFLVICGEKYSQHTHLCGM